MTNYLIPANSKKSMLILGFFTGLDLIIFSIGVIITFTLLVSIKTTSIGVMILILLPALITAFLVMPVPNYHNMLQLILNIIGYYSGRRRYYWKGWCMGDGENRSE